MVDVSSQQGRLFTIPAGMDFAHHLALGLFDHAGRDQAVLADYRLFLPTHRALRTVREAFLRLSTDLGLGGIMLPRLYVIGDLSDEDMALFFAQAGRSYEPALPVISVIERQVLLAKLIQGLPDRAEDLSQALVLASALCKLMDQVYTEGLAFEKLYDLVPDDFAQHWQITLDFLKILSEAWPAILAERGLIDGAARRDYLIRQLADLWLDSPPSGCVFAAGTTGSIPATSAFLKGIFLAPQGGIILPGFDLDLSLEAWGDLSLSHPQAGFKTLLDRIGSSPDRVDLWPACREGFDDLNLRARHVLAREIMASDHGSPEWRARLLRENIKSHFEMALQNLDICVCETPFEESQLIALRLREALEGSDKVAVLISPDRNLARRVIAHCTRWGISLDDSGGEPFSKTSGAVFFRLVGQWMAAPDDPLLLLAVLKHTACMSHFEGHEKHQLICECEKILMRSSDPKGWGMKLDEFDTLLSGSGDGSPFSALWRGGFLSFLRACSGGSIRFKSSDIMAFVAGHVFYYDCFAQGDFDRAAKGFLQENTTDFESVLNHQWLALFESFSKLGGLLEDIHFSGYLNLFDIALQNEVVRESRDVHPRLKILGQMESRIAHADLVIMAGLNEGVWPEDGSVDPWMSRTMQEDFGLPLPDQYLSLSAHDFVQGLCQPHVVITRCARIGGGLSVPSRWLQKLDVALQVLSLPMPYGSLARYEHYLTALSQAGEGTQIQRPVPVPDLHVRPARLSVTQMEMLMRDPYSLYALKILNLKPLADLTDAREAALKGMIIHDVLEQFNRDYAQDLPGNSLVVLMDLLQRCFDDYNVRASLRGYWALQCGDAFSLYLQHEKAWRAGRDRSYLELTGSHVFDHDGLRLELTGRADRIDILENGSAAVIDYKTGGSYSGARIKACELPQLPLEALLLARGGFDEIDANSALAYLGYWLIKSGGDQMVSYQAQADLEADLEDVLIDIEGKLFDIMAHYYKENLDGLSAYPSLPSLAHAPAYNDYMHLSRAAEWSTMNVSADESGGE